MKTKNIKNQDVSVVEDYIKDRLEREFINRKTSYMTNDIVSSMVASEFDVDISKVVVNREEDGGNITFNINVDTTPELTEEQKEMVDYLLHYIDKTVGIEDFVNRLYQDRD